MPVEAERGALLLKVQNCIPAFQQVAELLGVMQGSMDDGEAVSISRVGALSQPLQVLLGDRLPGEEERDADPLAQDIVLRPLDQILVVVAQDRLCAVLANQPQALGGSRPVADYIPEAEDLIDPLPSDVLKHGFQGINVAMDIGDECDARHRRGNGDLGGIVVCKNGFCHHRMDRRCRDPVKKTPGGHILSSDGGRVELSH